MFLITEGLFIIAKHDSSCIQSIATYVNNGNGQFPLQNSYISRTVIFADDQNSMIHAHKPSRMTSDKLIKYN